MSPADSSLNIADAPRRVRSCHDFLARNGVWGRFSRNGKATSCRDAASKRERLGETGIPLYDELKSLCVAHYRPEGRSLAMLHCRANARFDLDLAGRVLHSSRPLARVPAAELLARYETVYGTVNPFSEPGEFVHLFDEGVLLRHTPPHTMMTNAGDSTWAVEFVPQQVVRALQSCSDVRVARITGDLHQVSPPPTFGILTGNGPESGQALWQLLNESVRRGLIASGRTPGDLLYPRVLIESDPEMGLSMELVEREPMVWEAVRRGVEQLCNAGASVLAIACNTTQWYAARIRELCDGSGVIFVSMAETTIDYVRTNRVADATIVGIPIVSELGDHSAYQPLASMGVRSVSERARPHLQELGYLVKRIALGEKSSEAMNALRHVLRAGVETDHVIIALTEISTLLHRFPRNSETLGGKKLIDPLRIYGEALASLYLSTLPPVAAEDEPWFSSVEEDSTSGNTFDKCSNPFSSGEPG